MNDSLVKEGGTKNDLEFGTAVDKREKHNGNSTDSKEDSRKFKVKA